MNKIIYKGAPGVSFVLRLLKAAAFFVSGQIPINPKPGISKT